MELEEKLKAAKVPMIVVHFDENFETTYTEEYNLENFELSEWQIDSHCGQRGWLPRGSWCS